MAGRRDYDDDKEKIRQFLEEFTSPDDGSGRKNFKYYDQMVKLAHRFDDNDKDTPPLMLHSCSAHAPHNLMLSHLSLLLLVDTPLLESHPSAPSLGLD